jgi:hypothetical protein
MGIHKKILESLASDQAKKAGLVSKGGGAWAKEKGGATVAKTVGGKLVSVGDGETKKEPEKKDKPKKQSGKNIPGGSPALVPYSGTDPESIEGINDDQKSRQSLRDIGKAGAGGKKASQGESVYCDALNSLDNDKFKEENKQLIKSKKPIEPSADDILVVESLGLDPNSEEGQDYLAAREVFADKELDRIKKVKNNVLELGAGFDGNEEDYKSWMRTAYDGALATRKVLKEDTAMDTSKPMTTIQSEADIDDKIEKDLEKKMAAASGEDKEYFEKELKEFKKFREYHDTYTVGVDSKGRTHIVSISNKKNTTLKDPQSNTTPAARLEVIKERFGEKVAQEVTTALDKGIDKVRNTKENVIKAGSEIEINNDLIKSIKLLGPKYTKKISQPPSSRSGFGKWLAENGKTYPKGNVTKEQLELRNEYVNSVGGKASYNDFGRIYTKIGEEAKKSKWKGPKGANIEKCMEIKNDEATAVSQAHKGAINDLASADEKEGFPDKDGNNGPHTQGYIDTVMDAMHFNSYIDGGDGKMIVQMGVRSAQPSQMRGCLAELSGFKGDVEGPDGRQKLKDHLRKRCKVDEKNGNILIQDEDKITTLAEDTWRTAGSDQKVASSIGATMRNCLSKKVDNKRQERETSEQKVYESMASAVRRVARANL